MRGIIVALVVLALAPLAVTSSDAVLWDLIVEANVVGEAVYNGDIVIAGIVTDHAGLPKLSTVQVMIGEYNIEDQVDTNGQFEIIIKKSNLLPGTHLIHIRATTQDGLLGLTNLQVRVEGDFKPSEHTARILASKQAMRYLNADITDFENRPLEAKLYDYYQKLLQQMIDQRTIEDAIEEKQLEFAQVQLEAYKRQQIDINKEQANNDNRYQSYERQVFLASIDESYREIFIEQLDYTLSISKSLSDALETAPDRSTAIELMRKYNMQTAIPRHVIEGGVPKASSDNDEQQASVPSDAGTNSTETAQPVTETAKLPQSEPNPKSDPADNTSDDDSQSVTTVYLNVDGVMTKYLFDGTSLSRAE